MMLACHTTETNHCLLEGWKVLHAESWLSPGAAGWGLSVRENMGFRCLSLGGGGAQTHNKTGDFQSRPESKPLNPSRQFPIIALLFF